MRKEHVAARKILVPHLGVKLVDRDAQDDQFGYAAEEGIGHGSDLFFERTVHEAHLG
jgi:hypothetical protein